MKGLKIPVRTKIRGVVFILLFLLGLTAAHSGIIEVSAIGVREKTGEMTITLEFTEPVNYRSFTLGNPPRLVLDIPGATLKEARTIEVKNEVVKTISYLQYQPDTVRIVVNLTQPVESRVRKAGEKLLLYFSLPQEVKACLRTEERAKAKADREMERKLTAQERARIKREKEEEKRLVLARKAELKEKEEEKRRLEAERRAREKEEEERRRAEERARQLLAKSVKRETKLKAKKAISKKKLAEKSSRREAEERKKRIETYLSQGKKYYRDNRFDEAIKEFEAVLALDLGNGEAQNYLSLAREGKEKERRQREIRRREEEKEKKIVEYLNRGKEYCLQGRYTEAISEADKVLALSPGNKQAEKLIMQSKREALKVDKKKAQAEREIVEGRRTLDVSKAIYTSPTDYSDEMNPEKRAVPEEESEAPEEGEEEEAGGLREEAEKTLVKMEFEGTNLYDVIIFLSKMSKVNIAIDERALEELDNPDVTIYIPTAIPLTEALKLILNAKGLDYVIKEHLIWVTKKGLGEEAITKAYRLKYGIRKIRAVTLTLPEEEE